MGVVEHSECGECVDFSDMRIRIPGVGDSHDVHRRNISTLASPVILMFDGFHNIVYHVYLATRYLLSMALLLLRLAISEIWNSADRKSSNKGPVGTNITENKMADFEDNPELLKSSQNDTNSAVTTYNEEAENFAVQHRVNKLKQHHRRAFDLISKALKIDEEIGNKDGTTVELYKKGINELEKGLLLEFCSTQSKIQKDCHQAQKLQHKMKLNLDMAKKRLDYHLNLENRKS